MSTPSPREQFLVISALGANPMELTNVLCRAANENRCAVVSTRLTRHGQCSALVLEVGGSWDARPDGNHAAGAREEACVHGQCRS